MAFSEWSIFDAEGRQWGACGQQQVSLIVIKQQVSNVVVKQQVSIDAVKQEANVVVSCKTTDSVATINI